jgi:hypothetical protein
MIYGSAPHCSAGYAPQPRHPAGSGASVLAWAAARSAAREAPAVTFGRTRARRVPKVAKGANLLSEARRGGRRTLRPRWQRPRRTRPSSLGQPIPMRSPSPPLAPVHRFIRPCPAAGSLRFRDGVRGSSDSLAQTSSLGCTSQMLWVWHPSPRPSPSALERRGTSRSAS